MPLVATPAPSVALAMTGLGDGAKSLRQQRLERARWLGEPFRPGQTNMMSSPGAAAANRLNRIWRQALAAENLVALEALLLDAQRLAELEARGCG